MDDHGLTIKFGAYVPLRFHDDEDHLLALKTSLEIWAVDHRLQQRVS